MHASTRAGTVTVTLFADLRRYVPRNHDGKLTIEIGEDAVVRDVLEAAYPELPFTWLEVSAGDEFVFLLHRNDLI